MTSHLYLPAALRALLLGIALVAVPGFAEIEELEVDGIPNFSHSSGTETFAGSKVGFGGPPEASAMAWLASQGYVMVLNLQLPREEGADVAVGRAAAESAGLAYVNVPFDPGVLEPDTINRFLTVAADSGNHPVFIHCNSATRVAALWMIGRVRLDGLEPDEASREGQVIAKKPEQAQKFFDAYLASGQSSD